MTVSIATIANVLTTAPKGANVILEWERPVETLKKYSDFNIVKKVRMVGRVGIDYENIQSVKDGRKNGELPSEPVGSWFDHDENVKGLIYHKTTRKPYVQLFTGTSKTVKPSATFFIDGVEMEKSAIEQFITAKEKREGHGVTFICKVENMTRIHTEVEAETEEAETV